MKDDIHNYDDIINITPHISKNHPQMTRAARAAQFAPFAALTTHKEVVKEKERLVETKRILGDDQQAEINAKLIELKKGEKEQLLIKVTYFKSDLKKAGGEYLTIIDKLKKIDEYTRTLVLNNGDIICVDDIYNIEIQIE